MAGSLSVATLVANTPVLVQWKDETIEHFLGRMTHLNLVAKNISTLRGIAAAPKLKVIYAFNNRITELPPDLLKLGDVQILMLDDNEIGAIEHLSNATELTKLYLARNRILELRGLEACRKLVELHLGYQVRPIDAPPFVLGVESTAAFHRTLEVLDVSGLGLSSLRPLAECRKLRDVKAAENNLMDADELVSLVRTSWPRLVRIELQHNPITADHKSTQRLRDAIVCATGAPFCSFNGRELAAMQIAYIRRMHRADAPALSSRSDPPVAPSGGQATDFLRDEPLPAALRMMAGLGETEPAAGDGSNARGGRPASQDRIPITIASSLEMYPEAGPEPSFSADGTRVRSQGGGGGGGGVDAPPRGELSARRTPTFSKTATEILHPGESPIGGRWASRKPVKHRVDASAIPAVHYDPRLPTAAFEAKPHMAVGTRSGFRPAHASQGQDTLAPPPMRTPSDSARDSRFANSPYASAEVQLRYRRLLGPPGEFE